MAGDGINCEKPGQQRQLAAVEDGAGGDRGLPAAGGAFIRKVFGFECPGLGAVALWADEAGGPSFFEEVARAGGVVWEPRRKGCARHGAVGFPAARHGNKIRTFVGRVKSLGCYL